MTAQHTVEGTVDLALFGTNEWAISLAYSSFQYQLATTMKGQVMEITVMVFKDDDIEVPESPEAFMEFWQEKIDLIPKEFLSTAKVDLDCQERWGSAYLELEISYRREETPQELAIRKGQESKRVSELEIRERTQLAKLQEKYGKD